MKLSDLDVVSMIYKEFEANNVQRTRKMRHYPSSMSHEDENGNFVGKCRRAVWYDMMGTEKTNPIDATALFKMRVGDDIHNRLNGMLDSALGHLAGQFGIKEIRMVGGEGTGNEQYFLWQDPELQLPFSGFIDKVFEVDTEDRTMRIACEWKSTYGFGANMIKKNGPREDNLLQSICYLEQDVYPLDAIWLIYVARDSGWLFGYLISKGEDGKYYGQNVSGKGTFEVEYDLAGIERSLRKIEVALEEKKAPDRDYMATVVEKNGTSYLHEKKSDWHCRYCDFKQLCWGVDV